VSAQSLAAEAASLIDRKRNFVLMKFHTNLAPLVPDTRHLTPENFIFLQHVVK
jgi:hypothetical protein